MNGTFVVGLLAIVVGTVIMLDRLGIVHAYYVFRLWPLILIWMGISSFMQKRGRGRIVGAGMLILVGTLNLLFVFGYMQWTQFWPVVLVGFGVFMIIESLRPKTFDIPVSADGSSHTVFGSVEKNVVTRDFKEATIESVFGSTELDLHQAEMADDKAFVNVKSVFGSVEIRIPDHWHVIIEANAVFGSCENKTRPPLPTATPKTLIVRGDAVFGSVEIKN